MFQHVIQMLNKKIIPITFVEFLQLNDLAFLGVRGGIDGDDLYLSRGYTPTNFQKIDFSF